MEWHPTLSRCFQPGPPEVGIAFCLTFPVPQTPELGQAHQVNSGSGGKQGACQEAPPSSPSRGGAGPVRRRGLEGGRGHTRLSPFSAAAPQHPRVALLPMAGEGATRPQGFRLPSFHVSDPGGHPPTQVPHVEMRAPSHAHAHARCMHVGVCTCGHTRTGSTCVHVYRHVYIKEAHARSVRTRNEHEKHTHEARAHADMHTQTCTRGSARACTGTYMGSTHMHAHAHRKHTCAHTHAHPGRTLPIYIVKLLVISSTSL